MKPEQKFLDVTGLYPFSCLTQIRAGLGETMPVCLSSSTSYESMKAKSGPSELDVVAHPCNPSTVEAFELEVSLGYIGRRCLKDQEPKPNQHKTKPSDCEAPKTATLCI